MYYFLPKAADRPVFSYRLSIIHFWALIFIYIWAGPHHLLYTALPDWAQSLGMVFSLMLIAPSWGGMLNGLLTLRGAWDKVRAGTDVEIHGRGRHGLRHGHARRPDARHQDRQLAVALHGLDHRARSHRRAGLERLPHVLDALLAVPAAVEHQAVFRQAGQLAFLDRAAGHDVLRRADVRQRHHAGLDVEAIHPGRLPAISELPRNRFADRAAVQIARHRRLALPRRGGHR